MSQNNKEFRLESLKLRADKLGITYHPSIGEEKLQEKINNKLEGIEATEFDTGYNKKKSESDRDRAYRKANELVRVMVIPNDPNKTSLSAELFSVSNAIGHWKKAVPFNKAWHVPRIILNKLLEAEYVSHYSTVDKYGNTVMANKLLKAYTVQILDPLTAEELAALKQAQITTGRLTN